MKHVLSLLCLWLAGFLVSTSGSAQINTLFNPDYNGDGFIGVDDILGVLSLYDNTWDGPISNVVYGCTYPLFAEYDASATVDDGSCASLAGCTDSSYLEYDALANVDDGSCATLEVLGCTDSAYSEYDASANVDDGSCATPAIPGCTDSSYLEYEASANVDDGSCATFFEGCGNSMSYQGYGYATVLIGGQCWFAENLRSTQYNNGDTIPSNLSLSEFWSASTGAVAVYGEHADCLHISPDIDACDPVQSLDEYGRLYNWRAVDDARGLCPTGWHVPTDGEWTALTNHLGGAAIAGGQMKADYGWYNDGNGSNSSGFSGLPGGLYGGLAGDRAHWWSSSSQDGVGAEACMLFWWSDGVGVGTSDISNGFSVRCTLSIDHVSGCTDASACNYNELATSDDGSCAQADEFYDCEGFCLNDADGNGVCDELEPVDYQCEESIEYQGYDYEVVLIGGQCWFAENLRSENYANGDEISSNLNDSEWQNTTSGAVAVYGEEPGCENASPDVDACDPAQSLNEYGRLYNWHAVDDARGLCPSGWRVPSDEDWFEVADHLGGYQVAGVQMKTSHGWASANGTNSSGFSGLPGGYRHRYGDFVDAGNLGAWWSSSQGDPYSWFRFLWNTDGLVRSSSSLKTGYSVRCIRDADF